MNRHITSRSEGHRCCRFYCKFFHHDECRELTWAILAWYGLTPHDITNAGRGLSAPQANRQINQKVHCLTFVTY